METIIDDILIQICNFLTDREKIRLLSSCKQTNAKKMIMMYNMPIKIMQIIYLPYYHNFTNIILTKDIKYLETEYFCGNTIQKNSLPKHIKKIVYQNILKK